MEAPTAFPIDVCRKSSMACGALPPCATSSALFAAGVPKWSSWKPRSAASSGFQLLLVWGDRDCTVSLNSAIQLNRKLRNSELLVVPGGGHSVFEDTTGGIEPNHAGMAWTPSVVQAASARPASCCLSRRHLPDPIAEKSACLHLQRITKLSFSCNAGVLFAVLDLARWRGSPSASSPAIEEKTSACFMSGSRVQHAGMSKDKLKRPQVAWPIPGHILEETEKRREIHVRENFSQAFWD